MLSEASSLFLYASSIYNLPFFVGTQHDASANPFTFLFALMQKESDKEKNQGLRLRCYSDKAISGRS